MSSYVFLCLLMCSYVFLCLLMSSFDFLCLLLSSFVLLCPLLSSEVGEQSNSEVEVEVTFISFHNLKVDKWSKLRMSSEGYLVAQSFSSSPHVSMLSPFFIKYKNQSHRKLSWLIIISILRGIVIQAGAEGTFALETAMTEVGRPAPLNMESTVWRKPGIWLG